MNMEKMANSAKTNGNSTKVHISDQMDFASGMQLANREGFKLAGLDSVISRYMRDSDFRKELDESKGWVAVDYNSTLKDGNCELFENGSFKLVRDDAYDGLPPKKRGRVYNNGHGHVIVCSSDFTGESRRLEISTNHESPLYSPLPMRFAYIEDSSKILKMAGRR